MGLSSNSNVHRMTPAPIRVHTGQQRRGRKLPDWKQSRINQAVREILELERLGKPFSVRESAERYRVASSTLHRYVRSAHANVPQRQRSRKLDIDFLITKDFSPTIRNHHH